LHLIIYLKDIKILHDYSDMIGQFVQSLTTMTTHVKAESKSDLFTSQTVENIEKIIKKFVTFRSKMNKIKKVR